MDTQQLYDDAVARAIQLVGYGHELEALARPDAMRAQTELVRIVQGAPETRSPARLGGVEREIASVVGEATTRIEEATTDEFARFAEMEAAREAQNIDRTPEAIAALLALLWRQPYEGRTISEWYASMRAAAHVRILRHVRIGILTGQPPPDVAMTLLRNVRPARLLTTGQAAVARTTLTGVWNYLREWTWRLNPRIDRVQWRSTLDTRTSDICLGLHGTIFPVGEGERPPAHVRCRSIVIPLLRGEPVPQLETGYQWLNRQGPDIQRALLGARRAEALRDGTFNLREFFDDSGVRYTLRELAQRAPTAP